MLKSVSNVKYLDTVHTIDRCNQKVNPESNALQDSIPGEGCYRIFIYSCRSMLPQLNGFHLCMVDLFYDTTWLYGVVEFASSSSHNIIPPRHLSSFSLILFVLYYLL